MNHQETAQLISKMSAWYDSFCAKGTPSEMQKIIVAWQEMFSDVEAKKVFKALFEFTENNNTPYAPSPGQLIKIIREHENQYRDYHDSFMKTYGKYLESENVKVLESS